MAKCCKIEIQQHHLWRLLHHFAQGIAEKIRQRTGQTEANLILEGYLRFEYPDNGETWLFITSKDGKNVGVEGGEDFHGQTCFARGIELHQ